MTFVLSHRTPSIWYPVPSDLMPDIGDDVPVLEPIRTREQWVEYGLLDGRPVIRHMADGKVIHEEADRIVRR